ncbi:MAG TPA: signal recognition particle-docking protein FtsY [Terriglobia bacterium]|jgi:fused signal recognition particle receptor|nr:signal recognition particle-docking protein FtsY [Terriglobia bacterium]
MAFSLFGKGEKKTGFFDRLKQAVQSTKAQLVEKIEAITESRETVDEAALDELEMALIQGDLGVKTTADIMERLRTRLRKREIRTGADLRPAIEEEIFKILENPNGAGRDMPRGSPVQAGSPEVIFMVGVNGVGKTTTIAKLARYYQGLNARPLLAAADTFRAAAGEQLEVWADRLGVEIVGLKPGSDPAAVIYDALAKARRGHESPVIVDTAGRLHTKYNLMSELEKMCRIAGREVPGAPHQVLLVIDATTGQNGLQQARLFTEKAGVTGIVLTKLDGTAKGGVVVAIARELGLPIQFVGVGETLDDLLPFNPREFVASIFES